MRIASLFLLALSRMVAVHTLRFVVGIVLFSCAPLGLAQQSIEGISSREARMEVIDVIPFKRLSNDAAQKVRDVVDRPSFYRRMPTQSIECDPQMFTFLVRRPEVMVNIWDMMGITKVTTRRVSPYSFLANDGVGTACRCDLLYGDQNLHIYIGDGSYDGSMSPRKVNGQCVCILRSKDQQDPSGESTVVGTMDVFLKLNNLGADLLTRTIGPFVGSTADQNFVETAKFISQISQVCERSPHAAQGLAANLDKVEEPVRREFASIAEKMYVSRVGRQLSTLQLEETARSPLASSALPAPVPLKEPEFAPTLRQTSQEPEAEQIHIAQDTFLDGSHSRKTPESSESHPEPSRRIAPLKPNVYMRR